jgi:O-antigen ligase
MDWSHLRLHAPFELSRWNVLEAAFGALLVCTLFSGALQVSLYLTIGLPPVLGNALFALASLAGAVLITRSLSEIPLTPPFAICVCLWLAFDLWATMSVSWTWSLIVVGPKLSRLLVASTIYYLAGLIMGRTANGWFGFRTAILALSVATLVATAIAAVRGLGAMGALVSQQGALKLFAESYQATTLCVAVAAVIALIQALQSRRKAVKVAWIVAWAVLSMSTLVGGGRGAAIGCAVAQIAILVVTLSLDDRGQNKRLAIFLLAVLPVAAAVGFFLALQLNLETASRLLHVVAASSTDSTGRGMYWAAAVRMAELHPLFGAGLGSYESAGNALEDPGGYAHNVFLEALAETGVIGFCFLIASLIAPAFFILRRLRVMDFERLAIWLGLVAITAVMINVSGDVTERYLAFVLGLGAGLISKLEFGSRLYTEPATTATGGLAVNMDGNHVSPSQ